MHALIAELFPICRSITGDGLRRSLRLLARHVPLELHEVPTGTQAFDWTVPDEWNLRDAWVKDPAGRKVIDAAACNLHVVNYSAPVRARVPLAELKSHLFSLPEQPDLVPYRTTYYKRTWGFCLPHRQLEALPEGEYEVCVDATLAPGSLTWGEWLLPGRTGDEILFSCHACHPSLANDNLSGMAVLAFLAAALREQSQIQPLRYSIRFLFLPATIGSITWLSRNEGGVGRIKHGVVVACAGDAGQSTYKRTRRGGAAVDRAVVQALKDAGSSYAVEDFSPYGYDERQFNSPGFDLSVGLLTRTPHGRFPEYHTSADDVDFVRPQALADTLGKLLSVVRILEGNAAYVNTNPKCEPQLGRRGLYGLTGGYADPGRLNLAVLWVLNQSDGGHDLLSIAERAGMPFGLIRAAADALLRVGLLRESAGGAPD